MNPTVKDEELEPARKREGPGSHLKTVREAEGLDLSRVSVLLHLSEEKLEALEADDYAKLPGSVFVQGYLRNYARMLGVPVEPVLNAFHTVNPESNQVSDLKISQVRHEVGSGHALVRLVTWGIAILIIGLVVVWWRGYLQWPMQMSGSGAGVQSELQQDASDAGFDPTQTPVQPLTEVDASGEAALLLPDYSSAPEQEASGETAEPDSTPVEPEPEVQPQPEAEAPDEMSEPLVSTPAAPEPEAPSPVQATERVVLEFSGTSWTKIVDASGQFRVEGQIKAGVRQVLQGRPPYRLVLGNASVVRMLVDGEVFDLAPFTRGNVARLSFDPDS